MTTTVSGQIVLKHLEENPTLPSMTLAKLIWADEENRKVFNSLDSVRSSIRYYKGANGEKARKELKDHKYADIWAKIKIPVSDGAIKPMVFRIPEVNNNILVLADTHVPYHAIEPIKQAVAWGKERDVNTVLLLGDMIDFYQLSNFIKDPRKRDVAYEIDQLYELLYFIQEQLPKAKIYYLEANHEYRLQRYLITKAPELLGMAEFELPILAKFADFGIEWLPFHTRVQIGQLMACHGDEFMGRFGDPVNPARSFAIKGKTNIIGAHSHRSSSHGMNTYNGEFLKTWSIGCLCSLYPDWRPVNEWNHGFARIRQYENGEFDVFNAEIHNGRISG